MVLDTNANSKEKTEAYKDLAAIVENVAYEMTEIMVRWGRREGYAV